MAHGRHCHVDWFGKFMDVLWGSSGDSERVLLINHQILTWTSIVKFHVEGPNTEMPVKWLSHLTGISSFPKPVKGQTFETPVKGPNIKRPEKYVIGVVWVIRHRDLVLLDISPYTQISRYNTCLPMVCNKNYATIKSEVRFLELCLVSKLDLELDLDLN